MGIRLLAGGFAFALAFNLSPMDASAGKSRYIEEEVVNGGSISGVVSYDGPLKDVRIDLMKEKNGETCSKHPEAEDGVRFDHKIMRSGGLLQNAVVFIKNIERGKAWEKKDHAVEDSGFTNFYLKNFDIFHKFSINKKPEKKKRGDNPTGPPQEGGLLHTLFGFWVSGPRRRFFLKKPLS